MPKTVTIVLDEPLTAHEGKKITQVILREPTMDEYFLHGDPWTVALSEKGMPFSIENGEVISQYARLCLVEPKDPGLINQGGITLAKKIKAVILGFCRPGGADDAASETSPTNSPGTATSAPATSPGSGA